MADIRAFDVEDGKPKKVSLKKFDLGEGEYLKALTFVPIDASGLSPGDDGYVGPVVQAVLIDQNGDPVDPATSIKLNEPIPLESFDETDLSTGTYTVVTTDTVAGFGIHNNSTENSLTFTINSVSITVGAGASFYFSFDEYTTVTVSGTSLDFDAFVAGFTD